jgi:Flp pilus assembly protein CpaB
LKRSNRLILLIGVFLAALAFVLVIVFMSRPQTSTPGASAPPTKIATVIATRDIALGVTVTADMLTVQQLDTAAIEPGAFQSISQVIGKVARANIVSGQQVTTTQFTDTGVGSTQITCPAGFDCIAVQVDQVSGVGTLIRTGDYVDVVAQISPAFPINYFADKATTPTSDGAKYDPTSVKVLVQGLQVMGTLLPPAPTAPTSQNGTASPAPSAAGTALNGQQEIVILAATTQQVEVIKFAQVDGNITLTLRSPKDFVDDAGNPIVPEASKTTGLVLRTMITDWGVLPPLPIVIPAPSPAP